MADAPYSATAAPLHPLLEHLSTARPEGDRTWRGWHIQRIDGGYNGLVYRATGPAGDLAIKFSRRDARDRAGREYGALLALQQLGLDLAPRPVLLERDRYAHPVVVQSWLEGTVTDLPPRDDAGWRRLCEHYAAIHAITTASVAGCLPRAVVTARCADDGLQRIARELERIPPTALPTELQALVAQAGSIRLPTWPEPPLALCRVDPNPLNLVRRRGPWASVDWENSGWGDPAFEIGDLMAFAAYAPVRAERWGWLIDALFPASVDPWAPLRVRTYYALTLVWWAVRFARLCYEIEHGAEEQRLVPPPAGWRAGVPAQYARDLARAQAALERYGEDVRQLGAGGQ